MRFMKWIVCLIAVVGLYADEESCWERECECASWWDRPIFCTTECCCPVWWDWLPEQPILFRPFMADPRQITSSLAWRFDDQVLVKNVIPVSYGDYIPIIRFYNIWPWCGQLQFEGVGAVWAVFDPLHFSSPLIDADYYIGGQLAYAIPDWQFRLRVYHISTHLGDEFLLDHPGFHRLNPSAEYIDFFISNDFTDEIRLYGGLGFIMHQDDSFLSKRFYAELGTEIRPYGLGFYSPCDHLYGVPVFGIHLRHKGDFKRHVDMTYALGYEFGKTVGLEHRMRFQIEYHDGYALDGQFAHETTNFFQVMVTYGY